MSRYGDGSVGGLLSVDLSDWETPGTYVRKPARECSREEIRHELWCQLKAHLNRHEDVLRDEDLVTWYLADSIEHVGEHTPIDHEPLLTNTVGSWWLRPDSAMGIENFFLAGDYVRTNTDLATMESANESARRAVNAILDRTGNTAGRCRIWDLDSVAAFAPLRAIDRTRYERGLPPLGMPAKAADGTRRYRSEPPMSSEESSRVRRAILRAATIAHEGLSDLRDTG
jgi:uncharacterized protein with NAD-binding domain and iron-sulfur cluster